MEHLDEVRLYTEAYIHKIHGLGSMKRRLLDLGFLEGCCVTPVLNSPSKGMRAYMVKGCKVALRNHDAHDIMVK